MRDEREDVRDEWAIVHRYLSGQTAGVERAQLERRLSADPELRDLVATVREALALPSEPPASAGVAAPPPPRGVDIAWRDVRTRMRKADVVAPRSQWSWRVAGLAMAAAVVMGVAVTATMARRARATAVHEYVTAVGQREAVTLDDGTQFTLAPASRLEVPLDYATGNRAVRVEGEAYFAVVHDARHPFAVRVRNAVVTDVGTRFDVRAYAGEPAIRVAVAEGEVSVRSTTRAGHAPSLHAGDLAIVSDGGIHLAQNANVATLTSWTSGLLTFDDVPLGDIVPTLERWYGVTIAPLDPTLATRRITLAARDSMPDQVLSAVAVLAYAHLERHGRQVTFIPSHPPVSGVR